jgi:hypothetical protein
MISSRLDPEATTRTNANASKPKSKASRMLTLIFAITPLNLLVRSLLNLPLEHPRPLGLVEPGDLEDLRRVQPRVRPTTHDGDCLADPTLTTSNTPTSATGLASRLEGVGERRTYISYTLIRREREAETGSRKTNGQNRGQVSFKDLL